MGFSDKVGINSQHEIRVSFLEVMKTNYFFAVNQLAEYFRVNPNTIWRRSWATQIPGFKVEKIGKIIKKDIKRLRQ